MALMSYLPELNPMTGSSLNIAPTSGIIYINNVLSFSVPFLFQVCVEDRYLSSYKFLEKQSSIFFVGCHKHQS